MVSAALLMSAAGARAADWSDNFYLSAGVGDMFQQKASFIEEGNVRNATFDPGIRADINLGYNLNDSWAVELESGFMWNSIDTINGVFLASVSQNIDMSSVPILANVIYKMPTKTPCTPYLGVGAGGVVSMFDLNNRGTDYRDTDFTFAYQAEAGLDYALSKNISIGIAYKFLGTLNQRYYLSGLSDHIKIDGVYIHSVVAKLTWTF